MEKEPFLLTSVIKTCDLCSERLGPRDRAIRLYSGQRLCALCIKNSTVFCSGCSTRILKSIATFMRSEALCHFCRDRLTLICPTCSKREWKNLLTPVMVQDQSRFKYSFACDNCKYSFFAECSQCMRRFEKRLVRYCDGHGRQLCSRHAHPVSCDGYNYDLSQREKGYAFTWGDSCRILGNARFMGVEIEAEMKEDMPHPLLSLPKGFVEMTDGSLINGTEVATPPASGKEHYRNIQLLCKTMREAGYLIEETCGLHVHIDMREKKSDFKYLAHLFTTFFAIEDILYAMQPESRQNNKYCKWLRDGYNFFSFYGKDYIKDFDFKYYKKDKKRLPRKELNKNIKNRKYTNGERADSHHYGVNMHSIFYRGTLEIRMHAGSLNPVKITRWCDLMQRIVSWIDKKYKYKTVLKLLQMDVGEEKLRLMQKVFRFPNPLYAYMRARILQFHHLNTSHFYVIGETPGKYKTMNIEHPNGDVVRRIII